MHAGCALHCGKAPQQQLQQQSQWWVDEVTCLIDIWADEHISHWWTPHTITVMFIKLWANQLKREAERSVSKRHAKTATLKGMKPYCSYWQAIFRLLLPGRTYWGHLFRLLGRLGSHCERTAPGFEWNPAESSSSRWSCRVFVLYTRVRLFTYVQTNQRGNAPLVSDNDAPLNYSFHSLFPFPSFLDKYYISPPHTPSFFCLTSCMFFKH